LREIPFGGEKAMAAEDSLPGEQQVQAWLQAARQGSSSSLGKLLESCRNYLLLIANQSVDNGLRAKIGPSDLVQETFLRAQNHWRDFQGDSEQEWLAWLRQILVNQLHDARRDFEAQKRQLDREVAESASQLRDPADSPSAEIIAAEERTALQRALSELSAEQRQAVIMRNWERRSFKDIGAALGRSPEAARKLWARAIEKLQQLLDKPADP